MNGDASSNMNGNPREYAYTLNKKAIYTAERQTAEAIVFWNLNFRSLNLM